MVSSDSSDSVSEASLGIFSNKLNIMIFMFKFYLKTKHQLSEKIAAPAIAHANWRVGLRAGCQATSNLLMGERPKHIVTFNASSIVSIKASTTRAAIFSVQ